MSVCSMHFLSYSCLVFMIHNLAPQTDGGNKLAFISGFLTRDGWSRVWSRFDDSKFTKSVGSELKMQPGDTVVMSVRYESKTVRRPWHWFYAVTPSRALKFMPTVDTLLESVKPKLIEPAQRYGKYMLMNRSKKPGHIGLVGSLVATLMAHHKHPLPFNPLFCSAKHYVEYLSLGAVTGGKWYSVMYNKVAGFCPVRATLRREMLMQIYDNKEFTLKPKEGAGDDIVLKIDKWPDDIQQLVKTRSGASSPKRG